MLVLRALGLGDLLAGVPALRALRRGFPGYEIVLAAPEQLAAPAAASGAVDRLLPASAPGRAVPVRLEWEGPPPDVAVDLHGNGPSSHRLLQRMRPGRLLAFAHPGTPEIAGPEWRAEEHERARWCRLLEWYGIPADPADLRLPVPGVPSPAPGAVVVHPGADSGARRWPAERYAAVVRGLRRHGYRVVLTGGPGEDELLDRVRDGVLRPDGPEAGGPLGTPAPRGPAGAPAAGGRAGEGGVDGDVTVFRGGLPFERLAALFAGAAAVVSGDTGIAHLAVAYGVPSVTLFGPVSPGLWGPPPGTRHVALWHPGPSGSRPGDPHGREPDPRLLRIRPDDVLKALFDHPEVPRPWTAAPPLS